MAPPFWPRRILSVGLGLASITHALNLTSFAGQSEARLLEAAVASESDTTVSALVTEADDAEEDEYVCSKTKDCKIGCCGALDDTGAGVCGLGPDFCGDGCFSTCDYKSECDPGWGIEWSNATNCPLSVCCSDFGFCGTTSDFCGDATVLSPECSQSERTSNFPPTSNFLSC
ncbi:hypothetical protein EDB81DRAFT_916109 [Dactylonectria macrodidyma]|uniref:Chitin-binding type-1 domain-containing protein n=1 Tax=Dactylonectria macrodidyma TaxID=307937 RepID=A0A9P9DDW1_9HYPO|nr:hypothetical protein EDB81DRAFT_916109 [Dactylonectria macrodidyma]